MRVTLDKMRLPVIICCTLLCFEPPRMQTVTFISILHKKYCLPGPFLIIAPLSTIMHWQREFQNWSDMNTVVFHGGQVGRVCFSLDNVDPSFEITNWCCGVFRREMLFGGLIVSPEMVIICREKVNVQTIICMLVCLKDVRIF